MTDILQRDALYEDPLDRLDALEEQIGEMRDLARPAEVVVVEQPDWQTLAGWVSTGSVLRSLGGEIVLDPSEPKIEVAAGGYIQSADFVSGSEGFQINGGTAEFNDVVVRGTIYADEGEVGGWEIGTHTLTADSGAVGLNSEATAGTDWRIWAGHATPGSAPFRVDENGNLVATSGTIGGWAITADELHNTDIWLDAAAKQIAIGSQTFGNAGIQLEYNAGNPKLYVGNGTDRYIEYATILTVNGAVVTGIHTGSELSIQGWQFTGTFSSSDADTVAWTSGTLSFLNGDSFAIDAGNTGNMAARTYIYFDKSTSETALQTSTTASDAVGANKVLIAVAEDSTEEANFQTFGGNGGLLIPGDDIEARSITAGEIVANTITANEIAANTITAGEIAAGTITATQMAANTITAGEIAAGAIDTDELATSAVTATKLSLGLQDDLFSANNGLLLLGPGCRISEDAWVSPRDQEAELSGAFHQVTGRWAATKALTIERATTNRVTNPSFGVNTDGWDTFNSSISRITTEGRYDDACGEAELTSDAAFANVSHDYSVSGDTTDEPYTWSVWVKAATASDVGNTAAIRLGFKGGAAGASYTSFEEVTLSSTWQRVELTGTISESDRTTVTALIYPDRDGVSGSGILIDGAQLENSTRATSTCIGSLSWCSWSGTAHNSTSTRAATEVNLDDYARLLSGNDTFTINMWVQSPLDYDDDWDVTSGPWLATVWEDADNYISIRYNNSSNYLYATCISGATSISLNASYEFIAGEWLMLTLSVDFSSDEYVFYIQGVAENSDSTSLSNISPTQMNWGSSYSGSGQWDGNYAELAIFDSVLTAEEVAALYQRNSPLVDNGSFTNPGIYMLDGQFRIATSLSGARTDFNSSGWFAYDEDGDPAFGLSLEDGLSWGGFTADKADLILGNNVAGSAAIRWDQSTGKFGFYGNGSATVQVEISTDGYLVAGGGDVGINADGLSIVSGSTSTNRISFYDDGLWGSTLSGYVDGWSISSRCIRLYAPSGLQPTVSFYVGDGPSTGGLYLSIGGDFRFQVDYNKAIITEDLRVGGGLYVGDTGTNPDADDIWLDGDVRTAGGLYVGANNVDPDAATIMIAERSSDPSAPSEGEVVIWMSDGTGKGDDGDVMIASKAGGVTRYGTLFDHSAGSSW